MPLLSENLRNLSASLTVFALVIAGLVLGRDILIPLALAAVLAFILAPIVLALTKRRVPHGLAVSGVLLAVIAVVIGLSAILSAQMLTLTASLGTYRHNITEKFKVVTSAGQGNGVFKQALDAVDNLGRAIESEWQRPTADAAPTPVAGQIPPVLPSATEAAPPADRAPSDAPKAIIVEKPPENAAHYLGQFTALAAPLTYLALTFLFALFLLLQHSDLRDRVVRVAGTDNMTETTSAMSEAGERLSQLFLMQAALNAGFGLVVAIALAVIGLPNAMLWGVVAALMRFVPFIGSLLAAVPPMLLAAAVDPGWGMFIATVLVFAIGEPVMGHVVEPLVLGKRAGLSPFAMVIAASFWALVWGPVGLILAAPLTMSLVVLGRYISGLEFFTVLLGDEPALSPQETFYHRLLSDDSISAAQQLEDVAEEGSAFDVSDGVVLPALHLATMDQRRGRFDREGLAELRDTMGSVIGLVTEPASDKAPAGSGAQQDVLVVPARGMIDTAAADFVAAMLQRIPSLAPRASSGTSGLTALSDARTAIDKDELETLVLVTVGGIEPQQLQFIVRRAMRDFPTTRILVLDWGRGLSARRASDRNSDIAVPVAATYRDLTDALQLRTAKEPAPAKPIRALDALQAV